MNDISLLPKWNAWIQIIIIMIIIIIMCCTCMYMYIYTNVCDCVCVWVSRQQKIKTKKRTTEATTHKRNIIGFMIICYSSSFYLTFK